MMKRTLNHLMSVALVATLSGALATGCSSEDLTTPDSKNPTKGQPITITAGLPQTADTRMGYTEVDKALKTVWTAGDAYQVTSDPTDESQAKEFTLNSEDDGQALGRFTGESPATTGTYTIFYPSSIKTTELFNNFSYEGQVQTGNNNMDHLSAYHCMKKTTADFQNFSFSKTSGTVDFSQSSVMKFDLSGIPEQITPNRIILGFSYQSPFYSNNSTSSKRNSLPIALSGVENTQAITAYMAMSINKVSLKANERIIVAVECSGFYYYKEITIAKTTALNSGLLHTITIEDGWTKVVEKPTVYSPVADLDCIATEPMDVNCGNTGITAANPRIVDTAAKLSWIKLHADEITYYKLTADISIAMNGANWKPIGMSSPRFKGHFNGNGKTISGLFINNTVDGSSQGLFGALMNATIKNLTVTGSVTNTQTGAAGIAGSIIGSIIYGCHNACDVAGGTLAGGIANLGAGSAVIGCYNTGSVTQLSSSASVGGVAGNSFTTDKDNSIIGCYNLGTISTVEGGTRRGSIVGDITKTILKNCLYTTEFGVSNGSGSGSVVENNSKITLDELNSTNTTKGFAVLNAGIKTWNGENPDKQCEYHFEAGTTNPIIVEGAPQ